MFARLLPSEHATPSNMFSMFAALVDEPSLGILSQPFPCSVCQRLWNMDYYPIHLRVVYVVMGNVLAPISQRVHEDQFLDERLSCRL